jgi:hypothetical protein
MRLERLEQHGLSIAKCESVGSCVESELAFDHHEQLGFGLMVVGVTARAWRGDRLLDPEVSSQLLADDVGQMETAEVTGRLEEIRSGATPDVH